jgi:hypothetical protein
MSEAALLDGIDRMKAIVSRDAGLRVAVYHRSGGRRAKPEEKRRLGVVAVDPGRRPRRPLPSAIIMPPFRGSGMANKSGRGGIGVSLRTFILQTIYNLSTDSEPRRLQIGL